MNNNQTGPYVGRFARRRRCAAVISVVAILLGLAITNLAMADDYDTLDAVPIGELLSATQQDGADFRVEATAKTDGFLYLYEITSDYGPM